MQVDKPVFLQVILKMFYVENEKLLEVLFENINMDRRVSIMVVHETFNFGYSGSNPELCTKI